MLHKKLEVWKKSMDMVISVYKLTKNFPSDERFGLTNQMRRASVSIPSNIAEGCARNSSRELKQFLFIAQGSLSELETQLEISIRLGFAKNVENLEFDIKEIGKMLTSLIRKINPPLPPTY